MAETRNIPIQKYGRLACPWYRGSRLSVCRVCHFFKGTGGAFGSGTWVVCAWSKEAAAELDKKKEEARAKEQKEEAARRKRLTKETARE